MIKRLLAIWQNRPKQRVALQLAPMVMDIRLICEELGMLGAYYDASGMVVDSALGQVVVEGMVVFDALSGLFMPGAWREDFYDAAERASIKRLEKARRWME